MSKYTAEQAGALVKDWTTTKERLRKRLRGLDSAIDLDRGVKALDPRLKRRIAKLVREGFEPDRIAGNKYPEPADLLVAISDLRAQGKVREAAILSRLIRDIRLLRALAYQMSGKRKREPIATLADRRLVGVCQCGKWILLKEEVWWDRDRGVVWHREHGLEFGQKDR